MKVWKSVTTCLVIAGLVLVAAPVAAQVASTGVAPAPPEKPPGWGGGTENLSGSVVVFDPVAGDTEFVTGTAQTFCFRAESFTTDWEWAVAVWLRFPTDWTVTDVYVEGTPSCTSGGSFGTFGWEFQTSPYEVRINQSRNHANPSDHCTAHYCFDVTSGTGTPDAEVSWFWNGDGWGAAPNNPCSDDGYTPAGQSACDEQIHPPAAIPAGLLDPIMMLPISQTHLGCPGVPQQHDLSVMNNSGDATTVNLAYAITAGGGTCSGPASVAVADGGSEVITVDFTPMGALGETVTCEVSAEDAADPSSTATAHIHKELGVLSGWQAIATEPSGRMDNVAASWDGLIWSIAGYGGTQTVRSYDPATDAWSVIAGSEPSFGESYVGSGCTAGSKVFMYGDASTAGFTGLWSYDMATNTWTNESPSGTAPAQTGIWHPAWVHDPATGYCYMTGGATVSGGGNLTTVYVYDPATNAWLAPLPNFTSTRAFHAAFIVNDMLCVMGGVDSGSVVRSNTQCYDFTAGAWNAENADIPAIPMGWWGMGYADKLHLGTEPQLWLVGGVDSGFDLILDTYYFDVNAGTWHNGGPLDTAPVYRNDAVTHNNEIYKIGGSTGGFNPTGLADRHIQGECPPLGYILDIIIVGDGSVTRDPDQAMYDLNDVVTLEAIADPGWMFLEWSGDATGSDNPVDVTITGDMEVTATFVPAQATVIVEVGPGGGGTVTGGGPYTIGDMATVQAFPEQGWVFLYWEVNATQIPDNPYTFEVTGDVTLVAVFQQIEAIPTTGTVGLVLLLALLAGVGVFVLRRI